MRLFTDTGNGDDLSARSGGPFVEVNCAGLSATFLDSELFGHEKGAYTDAKERKVGLFELADHGTILLDEVGALAAELQPKLLEVLETKTFRRVGGTRELRIDTRLIAATNRDLASEVKAGRFREDLHDRLNARPMRLPPLRERSREDRLAVLTGILADLGSQMPAVRGRAPRKRSIGYCRRPGRETYASCGMRSSGR